MAEQSIAEFISRLPATLSSGEHLFRSGPGEVSGQFYSCRLTSVFQPVVRRAGGVVGHQGLTRCYGKGDLELSPWRLFADAASDAELVQLDRLVRTLHALNYFNGARADWRLFLAVERRLLDAVPGGHGQTFAGILAEFHVPPSRVVITLPESATADRSLLDKVVGNYRSAGYGVATCAAPGDWEQVSAAVHPRPDVVQLRFAAAADEDWHRALAAIRSVGATPHVTKVEDSSAHTRLIAWGVDWLQGNAISAPERLRPSASGPAPRNEIPTPRAPQAAVDFSIIRRGRDSFSGEMSKSLSLRSRILAGLE